MVYGRLASCSPVTIYSLVTTIPYLLYPTIGKTGRIFPVFLNIPYTSVGRGIIVGIGLEDHLMITAWEYTPYYWYLYPTPTPVFL